MLLNSPNLPGDQAYGYFVAISLKAANVFELILQSVHEAHLLPYHKRTRLKQVSFAGRGMQRGPPGVTVF